MRSRWQLPDWILLTAIIIYLITAVAICRTKLPWVDEGWNSAPVDNMLRSGSLGTRSLEPTGSWLGADLKGIRQHTYWIMPLPILAQAGWAKLFGFSLLNLRFLSVLWGLVCLLAWFIIISRVAVSRAAGALTVLLCSIDITFLWCAADVRMDMMCAALGSAGLAGYVALRERSLWKALWIANMLIAAATFTHPNGALAFVGLVWLIIRYDRQRMRWSHVVCLLPYLVFAAGWAAYALQQPDAFLAQLSANAAARRGSRWLGILRPWDALKYELLIRYIGHYGVMPVLLGAVPQSGACVPLIYWLACILAAAVGIVRRAAGVRDLLCLTVGCLLFMAFLTMKAPSYLIYILPLYAAVFALLIIESHKGHSVVAPVTLLMFLMIVVLQVRASWFKVRENGYARHYAATAEFLKKTVRPGEVIVAESFFGPVLGYENINDDARLGYFSRIHPDIIVADLWYCRWWRIIFPLEEPEVAQYVRRTLQSEYKPVFETGCFTVYRRGIEMPQLRTRNSNGEQTDRCNAGM